MSKVNIREIIATYRVVTPLFSAGADPMGAAELRVPSLKGVLSFWWRALAWSEFDGDLREIQKAEDELFGCGGEGARRSRVVMFLERVNDGDLMTSGELRNLTRALVGHGVRYLGYGLMGAFGANAGKITRACRGGPLEFKLHLRCRDVDGVAFNRLLRALRALGTVGGLGARSRRGFGSLVLTSLEVDGVSSKRPGTLGELRREIEIVTGQEADRPEDLAAVDERIVTGQRLRSGEPEYTAFSAGTRHVLVMGDPNVTDPLVLLDRVGREMVRFRSSGKNAPRNGTRRIFEGAEEAECNFEDDHLLMLDVAKQGEIRKPGYPERLAFGLPHNYFFSSQPRERQKVSLKLRQRLDRRASPLLIHVHMLGGRPAVVLSFLPARFLPNTAQKVRVGREWVQLPASGQLYRPIRDFLDRMMGKGRQELFGEALEVRYDAR